MCRHMVDGNEQKGRRKTTAGSEDAEAEIFLTFKWKLYIQLTLESYRKFQFQHFNFLFVEVDHVQAHGRWKRTKRSSQNDGRK